jgi:hypothetical protein
MEIPAKTVVSRPTRNIRLTACARNASIQRVAPAACKGGEELQASLLGVTMAGYYLDNGWADGPELVLTCIHLL